MNIYSFLSIGYDLLDKIWLSEKGNDPTHASRRKAKGYQGRAE